MKKLLISTLSVFCLIIALASCSSKGSNELIGKWEQNLNQQGVTTHVIYDFKEGGQLYQSIVMTGTTPKINIEGEGKCSYTFDNDEITFKFSGEDFDFSKFEIEGIPEEYIEMSMQQMKSNMVDMEQKITGVEINGDTLTGSLNGEKVTLTRVK